MTDERNIFIRIGVTQEEWDKLDVMIPDVGPAEAAEQVLEKALREEDPL